MDDGEQDRCKGRSGRTYGANYGGWGGGVDQVEVAARRPGGWGAFGTSRLGGGTACFHHHQLISICIDHLPEQNMHRDR